MATAWVCVRVPKAKPYQSGVVNATSRADFTLGDTLGTGVAKTRKKQPNGRKRR
jgi:hypothetical protein